VNGDGTPLPDTIIYQPVIGTISVPASDGVILRRTDTASSVEDRLGDAQMRLDVRSNGTASPIAIRFALPKRSAISLHLFDALGRKVMSVAEGEQGEGEHVIQLDGTLSAGVYWCVLRAGGNSVVRPLTVLR
jgi:hypothetical protein